MKDENLFPRICFMVVLAPTLISILILSGAILLWPLGFVSIKFVFDALGIVLAGMISTFLLGLIAYIICCVWSWE